MVGVSEGKTNFYRLRADFTVRKTGEKLAVNRVVPCARVFTTYKWGETTVDLKAQPHQVPYPFMDVKITKERNAVVVAVPNVCNHLDSEGKFVPSNRIPKPFYVRATWFKSADRLLEGKHFVRPIAYESPMSELEFHGASIEFANRNDYQAWLSSFDPDFKPTKNIIYPFGFSWGQMSDVPAADFPDGYGWFAGVCKGLMRTHITNEKRRAMLREKWPADRPRYWDPLPQFPKKAPDVPGLDQAHLLGAWLTTVAGRDTTEDVLPENEVFPLVRSDVLGPWFGDVRDYKRQAYADYAVGPEFRGFLTCVPNHASKAQLLLNPTMPFFRNVKVRLNGEELPKNELVGNTIERDEYIYNDVSNSITGESAYGN